MAVALLVQFVRIQDHQVSISIGPAISDLCKSKLGETPGSNWSLRSRPAMRFPNVLKKVKSPNLALKDEAVANLSCIKRDQGPPFEISVYLLQFSNDGTDTYRMHSFYFYPIKLTKDTVSVLIGLCWTNCEKISEGGNPNMFF